MVYACYEIGRMLAEEGKSGSTAASCGTQLSEELSACLARTFGRSFSAAALESARKFYLAYQGRISETVFRKFTEGQPGTLSGDAGQPEPFPLSWQHYLVLMHISDADERRFYEVLSARNGWSIGELKRQRSSALYERLALSTDKDKVWQSALQDGSVKLHAPAPLEAFRDPYVLEFLGLKEQPAWSESDQEGRIIDILQQHLLDLGTGFSLVGRQVRLSFDEDHFMVDLVFYNSILRCFVLVDVKTGPLTHQDIAQMQRYVHYYDRCRKLPDENPTAGILLCKEKNDAVVQMTLPEDNTQIYAGGYQAVLPDREALARLLEEQLPDHASD